MIKTAVPATVYTTALFSDAQVVRRSHRDDDDDDTEDDAALMGMDRPDIVREELVVL